jgi:hypothetical protein
MLDFGIQLPARRNSRAIINLGFWLETFCKFPASFRSNASIELFVTAVANL